MLLAFNVNARAEIFSSESSNFKDLPKKYQVLLKECSSLYKSKYVAFEIIGPLEQDEKNEYSIIGRNNILQGSRLYINMIDKRNNRFNETVMLGMPCYFFGENYKISKSGSSIQMMK